MPKSASRELEEVSQHEVECKCRYCFRIFRSQVDLEDHEELHRQLEQEDTDSEG